MGFRFVAENKLEKGSKSCLDERKEAQLREELAKWANMVKDHSYEQQIIHRYSKVRKKSSSLKDWGKASGVEKAIITKQIDLVFLQGNIDLNRVNDLLG